MQRTWQLAVIGTMALVCGAGCFAPGYGINRLAEDTRSENTATLLVAYPLKIATLDAQPVAEVGGIYTIVEMTPGEHEVTLRLDEKLHMWDRHRPTRSSGLLTQKFLAQPASLHVLRVERDRGRYGGGQFRTAINGGPYPFVTAQGHTISFDFENAQINVTNNGATRTYGLNSKLVFFSLDGKHLAFVTTDGDDWVVVRDGKEEGRYEGLHPIHVAWSADGAHLACGVWDPGGCFLTVDGVKRGPYRGLMHEAELFFDGEGRAVCGAFKGDDCYLIHGDTETKMDTRETLFSKVVTMWQEYVSALGFDVPAE